MRFTISRNRKVITYTAAELKDFKPRETIARSRKEKEDRMQWATQKRAIRHNLGFLCVEKLSVIPEMDVIAGSGRGIGAWIGNSADRRRCGTGIDEDREERDDRGTGKSGRANRCYVPR